MANRQSAMPNRETANVKRERVRDEVTFPTIYNAHSFHPSPFINSINPVNLINPLTRQLINSSTYFSLTTLAPS